MGHPGREVAAQGVGHPVLARPGHDVGGRPLQHGHGAGPTVDQGRHQGHRRGPAADDDDPLSLPPEVLGPVLGVDDGAAEVGLPGELGSVAAVVAVVPGVPPQEAAGELFPPARPGVLDVHRPPGVGCRPRRAHHPPVEPDVVLDPVGARRRADVVEDGGAVGDRLVAHPRLEGVAQREHVGVGPDPGVAEQVPRAADDVPGLDEGVGGARSLRLEVAGRPDSGQAGAHDQDVDVLHGRSLRGPRPGPGSGSRPGARPPVPVVPGSPGLQEWVV